ncbi:MAG: GGDEF domain-containing protein [Bacillus subtilis]|nr:GGDEF domain-containing protein [Bacillus subtilis]
MGSNYFLEAQDELHRDYGLDLVNDVLLGDPSKVIAYAHVANGQSIQLKLIHGSFVQLGLPEQRVLSLADLLQHLDLENKYAEVSGKDDYKQYVYGELFNFAANTDVTFPIMIHKHRVWLRITGYQAINSSIRVFSISDVSELLNREELIFEKTHKDALTGLFNKYTFDYHYGNRYQRKDTHVLYLDLDDFKVINDSFGHQLGDQCLQQFADILKSYETEFNRFYRIGGDEFLGLFFANETTMKTMAETIIARTQSILCEVLTKQLTVSIGIVQATKGINLAAQADRLLYQVKNLGKNSFAYKIE